MDRWEEEFEDLFDDVEGSFANMAKAYFKAGWMSAIQIMQDRVGEGFDDE